MASKQELQVQQKRELEKKQETRVFKLTWEWKQE